MDKLSARQAMLLSTLAGFCILAGGFLVGRAVGNGDDSGSANGSIPTRIATRQGSLAVPTLGEAKRIPTLEVTEQPTQTTAEESTTPSSTPEEAAPVPESESPTPSPEPAPEVTVAPSG